MFYNLRTGQHMSYEYTSNLVTFSHKRKKCGLVRWKLCSSASLVFSDLVFISRQYVGTCNKLDDAVIVLSCDLKMR